MRFLPIVIIIWLLLLAGCVSDYTGEIPESSKRPVLNALLAADSTLTLRLTWPVPITGKQELVGIDNASVQIWEDGLWLGLPHHTQNGYYRLDSVLKAGCTYRVEIDVPGFETITATTLVPNEPTIGVSHLITSGSISDVDNFTLTLGRPAPEVAGIWLYITEQRANGELVHEPSMLYSNSSLGDTFNRSYNSTADGGYTFSYDYFMRIHGALLSFDQNVVVLASFYPYKRSLFTVITAAADYDNYFRTAFLQNYWSPKSDAPFTYQPITVQSNVNNGFGIFAGYNVSTTLFE
jgi:hypothetical protein